MNRTAFLKGTLELVLEIGKRELTLLLLVLVLSFSVWSFAEIADEVIDGDSRVFDERVLLAMRNPTAPDEPWGPEWLQEVARDFTGMGGVAVLTSFSLFSVGYLYLRRRRRVMMFVIVSIAGGILLSSLLKEGFDRPRPELVPHGSYVYTASFPSGHSMMAAIVYLTLGALLATVESKRGLKVYLLSFGILLTLCVGVSRVYLGVHWPTDVLAGWTGGAAYASACWVTVYLLQRKGKIERVVVEE